MTTHEVKQRIAKVVLKNYDEKATFYGAEATNELTELFVQMIKELAYEIEKQIEGQPF